MSGEVSGLVIHIEITAWVSDVESVLEQNRVVFLYCLNVKISLTAWVFLLLNILINALPVRSRLQWYHCLLPVNANRGCSLLVVLSCAFWPYSQTGEAEAIGWDAELHEQSQRISFHGNGGVTSSRCPLQSTEPDQWRSRLHIAVLPQQLDGQWWETAQDGCWQQQRWHFVFPEQFSTGAFPVTLSNPDSPHSSGGAGKPDIKLPCPHKLPRCPLQQWKLH